MLKPFALALVLFTLLVSLAGCSPANPAPKTAATEAVVMEQPTEAPLQPSATPVPPTPLPPTKTPLPTQEPQPTPEAVVAQDPVRIGVFEMTFLRFDPAVWSAVVSNEADDGQPVYDLTHSSIAGCVLHDNLGHGVSFEWSRVDEQVTIGSLTFNTETWLRPDGSPALRIYDYQGLRFEVTISEPAEECLQAAEAALALSEDLILNH